MNIDIERLKHDREYWDEVAPEGATHYGPESATHCAAWFKGLDDCTQHCMALIPGFNNDLWHNCLTGRDDRFPRPSPAWNGDGLPPVGCSCLMDNARRGWAQVEIVSEKNGYLLGWCEAETQVYFSNDPQDFRPLKSEKDRVVEAVARVMGIDCPIPDVMNRLYDVGALKMPEGE